MIVCWRCGHSLAELTLPLARLDECPSCNAQLHICRMCLCYDPAVTKACREDDADEIREKERANFCDYFKPAEDAFDADRAFLEQQAAAQLHGLFGDDGGRDAKESSDGPATRAAEDLFGKAEKE
jgi:hypothetical protein